MLERLRLVAFRVAMQLQSSPLFIFSTRRIFLRLCGLKLERGVQVWHGVRIGTEKLVMAKGAGIAPGSHVGGAAHIFIGEDASIGPNVFITSSNHEIGPASRRLGDHFAKPILIERGAWIGANCTILPGVTIGEGCVIAAGALVHKDCPPNGFYAGNPARRIRTLPLQGEHPISSSLLAAE